MDIDYAAATREIQVVMRAFDTGLISPYAASELIKKVENNVAGMGPAPTSYQRDTCPVPGCEHCHVQSYYGPESTSADHFWRLHFNIRHPEALYLGFIEDEINVRTYNGNVAVHEERGIRWRPHKNGAVRADWTIPRPQGTTLNEKSPVVITPGPGTTAEIAEAFRNTMGVAYPAPTPNTAAVTAYQKRQAADGGPKPKEEMGYRIKLAKRWGWWVRIDMHDGGTWEIWRPTRKGADSAGYKRLAREVRKRERFERAQQVHEMTWGQLRGTSNGDTSKDHEEWDAAFEGKETP